MIDKEYISYSKCFKSKGETSHFPEYLSFLLKNKDNKKPTNYRQCYTK